MNENRDVYTYYCNPSVILLLHTPFLHDLPFFLGNYIFYILHSPLGLTLIFLYSVEFYFLTHMIKNQAAFPSS